MRAADAAEWLAAFDGEEVAVTVVFPLGGGWVGPGGGVAPGAAVGAGGGEVEVWGADFDYPAAERALGGAPR